MDREGQLSNVAFAGAWSEEIARQEALQTALATLHRAARDAGTVDPQQDAAVIAALDLVCQEHPRGRELRHAWAKGAVLTNPGLRVKELTRIADVLTRGRADSAPTS